MSRLRQISSIEWMILGLWIIGFACYMTSPMSDPDTPWHLAAGKYILSHHVVPTMDPFSWSMHGKTWVTQEWLFEVILAFMQIHFGFVGIWFLETLVHTITVIALYNWAKRVSRGNRVISAVAATVGTLGGLAFWTIRPQTFSYMMFAIFLLILQQAREGRSKVLYFIPPLMLFWANVHGSSIIGILLLLLELILSFVPSFGRIERLALVRGNRLRLVVVAVIGFLVGLCNPNGLKAYTYALLSTNSLMTDNIMEWHSPDFHSDFFKYGVLSLLFAVFFLVIVRKKSIGLRDVVYFGGSCAATLIHQRFMPYLAILSVPLIAHCLEEWMQRLMSPSVWMRIANLVVLLFMVGFFGVQTKDLRGTFDSHFDKGAYPVLAVNWLKEQKSLPRNLLNAYQWGGYLIYSGVPTFVDGRTDIFLQNSIFSDYLSMSRVWWNTSELLNQYKINLVLFPSGDPIITYLEDDSGWHIVYRDTNSEIMERNKPM